MESDGDRSSCEANDATGLARFFAYFLVDITQSTGHSLLHNSFPNSKEAITELAIRMERETYRMPEKAGYSGEAARSVLQSIRKQLRTTNGDAFAREMATRGTDVLRDKPQ